VAGREQPVARGFHLLAGQRDQDAAGMIHALGDPEPKLARDQGLEAPGHAVGVRASASAELEHIAEPGRGDEASPRDRTLQERVRGRGGAVDDGPDPGRLRTGHGKC
jgi:hypothetical protein